MYEIESRTTYLYRDEILIFREEIRVESSSTSY
jgi:hypothetical protein